LEASKIFEELNDRENEKALGNTYMFLTACFTETSDFKKAFYYASKGINLIGLDESNPKVSSIQYYEILSGLHWKLQNYEQVKDYLNIVIKLTKASTGENAPTLPVLMSRLSLCYLNLGDIEKAEKLAKQAFNRAKAYDLSIKDNAYRVCLDNLSAVLVEQIKYKEAIKNIESTLSEEDKNYPNYWQKQVELANVYLMDHQCKKAAVLLDEAIKKLKTYYGKDNPDYINALNSLIIAQKCEKQYGDHIKNVKQANDLTQKQLVKQFSFSTNDLKRIFLAEIEASFNIYESINLDNSKDELTALNLENKYILKGLLLNQAKNIIQKLKTLNEPEINKLINDYIDNKQFLQRIEDKNDEKFNELKEEFTKTIQGLEIELVQLYNDRFKEPINFEKKWTKVRDQLKQKEAAIEFSRFNYITNKVSDSTYYVAYIIKQDYDYPKIITLFEETELKDLISNSSNPKELYNTRGSKATSTSQTSNSSELYRLIWKPLEQELDDVTTLYFAPSGLLHNISFSSIKNKDDLLINNYNLVQLSSTYEITNSLNNPKPNNILLVGGITYDYEIKEEDINRKVQEPLSIDLMELNRSQKNNSWSYLPGTLTEVNTIDNLLLKKNIDKEILIGNDANENYFKDLSGKSPRVMHIATHGFFFEEKNDSKPLLKSKAIHKFKTDYNPLNRTGLLLSGANYAWTTGSNPYEKENGIITAEEISTLDFSQTELAVLSACETGLGDIDGSEGVYGLQRAFKMAGVDMLMISLWEVPDLETAEFMSIFYTNWLNGEHIREAFRNTQLEMSNKYKDNPEKWAAFVLLE
jgi:CHAT domain-containing protein